jgi:SAM-dependent methyltransferase
MKVRDSGMPDEGYWESFFDVPLILSKLGIERFKDVAELGCGYGTFSIPVAKVICGTLYTFDIDPVMIARTLMLGARLRIVAEVRDVMDHGFGVIVDAVLRPVVRRRIRKLSGLLSRFGILREAARKKRRVFPNQIAIEMARCRIAKSVDSEVPNRFASESR